MKSFEELGLSERLLHAITDLGFETPMPVQEEVIPYLLAGEGDIVALAQTGTGKTAAFGLPLLQNLDEEQRVPQALIMCPTRELCLQISDDLKDYAKYMNSVRILPVYGGSSIESQIRALKDGVHIVVATPGRLLDLIRRNCVHLDKVSKVVMDEADEMLDMGFSDDINGILEQIPQERNTLLFSATMPAAIEKIARQYMNNPKEVVIGNKNESTASVRHIYYMVQAKDKYQTLKRIVDYYPNIYGIVFCRTKVETQEVAEKLIHDGYNADSLHGDLSQAQRDYVMQRFRIRSIRLLVATDVAARGLDVTDLTHIINYTLPDDIEVYTHRSGRTGRAGKTGISIAIINLKEKHRIKAIEKGIGKTFETAKMPTGQEICSKQIFNLMDRIEKVEVNEEQIASILPSVYRKLDWLDKEDLIKRMVSIEFNRLIDYYKDNEDIETIQEKNEKSEKRKTSSRELVTEPGYTKVYIGLGKVDGITPKNLLDLLNDSVEGRVEVGRIDLFAKFSLFDVADQSAKPVVNALRSLNFLGRKVRVEIAGEEVLKHAAELRAKDANEVKYRKRNRSRDEDSRPKGRYSERVTRSAAASEPKEYPSKYSKKKSQGRNEFFREPMPGVNEDFFHDLESFMSSQESFKSNSWRTEKKNRSSKTGGKRSNSKGKK